MGTRLRSIKIVLVFSLVTAVLPMTSARAASDPCATGSDPLCAQASTGEAACIAVGAVVRGMAPTTSSRSEARAPGSDDYDEQHLVNQSVGGVVTATAIDSSCEAFARPSMAKGSAGLSTFAIDLTTAGVPLRIQGSALTATASSTPMAGSVSAALQNLSVTSGATTIAVPANAPANTEVPLGSLGSLWLNEQWSSTDACRRDTGVALRLKANGLEVLLGWTSTIACKSAPVITTESNPGGAVAPGSAVSDTAMVGGDNGTPTGGVTFYLCGPQQVTAEGCVAGGSFAGSTSLVDGVATSPPSTATSATGRYCWRAIYSGDGTYMPAWHTNDTSECFTVEQQAVEISTVSSPTGGGAVPGAPAFDTATVRGAGPTPTGTVTFFLCAPADVAANGGDCATGGTQVGAPKALANGVAQSDATTTATAVGTYCWRAEYSGDSYYLASRHTDTRLECFTNVQQTPTITTNSRPSGPDVPPGTVVVDEATVTGPQGAPKPTGTVRFGICTPGQSGFDPAEGCLSGPLFLTTGTLDANGKTTSPSYTPTAEGTYCWRAEYMGDAIYTSAKHTNATTECFTVRKQTSTITTTSAPTGAGVAPGKAATDTAIVSGNGVVPTGTVRFFLCNPQQVAANGGDCKANGTAVGGAKTLGQTGKAASDPTNGIVDTRPVGTYCWRAEYSGDAVYLPATHTNASTECFTVELQAATVQTSSKPQGDNVAPGTAVTDTAVVSGNGDTPTGSVTFYLCAPSEIDQTGCPATAGTKVGGPKALSGGTVTSDPSTGIVSTTTEGTYCWRVLYSGDSYYASVKHTNATTECFTVRKQTAVIETTSKPNGAANPGDSATDTATVTGSGPAPTGTVTFFLCTPKIVEANGGDCRVGGTQVGSPVTLAGNGTAQSADSSNFVDTTQEGTYCWAAVYSGDSFYASSRHTNSTTECFTVRKLTPTIRTRSNPSTSIDPGATVSDTAFVIGSGPVPTGSVLFSLCAPGQSGFDPSVGCTSGGATVGTVTLNGEGYTTSPAVTMSSNGPFGKYCWRAEYSGDAYYQSATHTNALVGGTTGYSECFILRANVTIQTTSSPMGSTNDSAHRSGSPATDRAEVSGLSSLPIPTGTITFLICNMGSSPGSGCVSGGSQVGTAKTLSGGTATSDVYTIPATNNWYCWRASYSGDAYYRPATHTDGRSECFQAWSLF